MQKQHVWEKPGSWIVVQKPQGQSECKSFYTRISQKKVEVEFLDVNRGLWKQQMLVACLKWVWSGMAGYARSNDE